MRCIKKKIHLDKKKNPALVRALWHYTAYQLRYVEIPLEQEGHGRYIQSLLSWLHHQMFQLSSHLACSQVLQVEEAWSSRSCYLQVSANR